MLRSLLRPLEVGFMVEERPFKLGGSIPITVDLLARRDVGVRVAWVDLVCSERWTGNFVVMAPTSSRPVIVGGGGAPVTVMPTPVAPQRVTEEFKQSYVHSRAVFLQDFRLSAGAASTYGVRLEIVPEPPDHVAVSVVTWKLALFIDVAHTLDVRKNHPVEVALD